MEKTESSNTAHVLVLPFPTQGHINPMLQFAKRLVSKGHRATLAPTISITKSVQIKAGPIGIEPISDGFDEHGFEEAGSIDNYLEHLEAVGSRTLAELIDNQNTLGNTIDCLLYDAFLPWALDVANKLSLYAAAFFTQSCVVDAIYYHVYKGKVTAPSETDAISWSGLPQLQICDLPSPVSVPVAYPGFIKLLLSQFSNLDKADCVLLNTFDELESEVLRYMKEIWPLKTVGPTIPSKYLDRCVEGDTDYGFSLYDQNAAICKKWLDEKPIGSVVYASFGSISVVGGEQMEELAWGLKRSNHNFLWVVRESEEKKLPTKFKDEIKGKGLIVTWCPQLEVLAHQSVGCFVTHCGWNSTLEALCLGVPMVALPHWTDQPTNAKFVEDIWGVGLRAKEDEKRIKRQEEIERCIREVMGGERGEVIRRNAWKWREKAKDALEEGGSSSKNIEEFVATIEGLSVEGLAAH